jgi:hypothetical protein
MSHRKEDPNCEAKLYRITVAVQSYATAISNSRKKSGGRTKYVRACNIRHLGQFINQYATKVTDGRKWASMQEVLGNSAPQNRRLAAFLGRPHE